MYRDCISYVIEYSNDSKKRVGMWICGCSTVVKASTDKGCQKLFPRLLGQVYQISQPIFTIAYAVA